MVASMGATAFADNENKGNSTNRAAYTTVKYDVTESYTWTVPATIDFTNVDNDSGNKTATIDPTVTGHTDSKVTVETNIIKAKSSLVIKIKTGEQFKIATSEGASLSYKVYNKGSNNSYNSEALAAEGTVLTVASGETGSMDLKFVLSKDDNVKEKAGNYTGTLNFTSEISTPSTSDTEGAAG